MKRGILLIIAVIFFIIMVSLQRAGAASELLGCTGEGCWETAERYLARHPCVKQWKIFDRRREQGSEWASISPNCPRPEKPSPECRWEWKSTLDLAGSSEWEPFSILESDEIEWGPKYGDSRTFSQRGITVKKTRIYLKRQVCEEAK